ncbi:MAG: hypothetical protein OXG72_06230 [Acidobacteria bacterium]|nr:hypothetical protein [Acidobacteriota bacterium]
MGMTQQTFHVTGLDPRAALCGRNGHIWAAAEWPSDDDMRSGMFVRCKDCDRLATPAMQSALESARDLELATLTAFKTGWREGAGLPTGPDEALTTRTYNAARECRELGRRVGTEAARLVREAQAEGQQPPSATLDADADAAAAAP